ncbi:MAG: SoxR reducing system RseC family protein [Gammaproteobacteria bacterium]|nr:SoxR reducing system RseC family protein [Gammaproteobacteria bacterium]
MLRCQAVVTRIDMTELGLSVSPQPACSSCSKGRGCGMQLFERHQALQLTHPLSHIDSAAGLAPLMPGQRVTLSALPDELLLFSLRAYLLPLMLGVLLATSLSFWGDLAAVAGMGFGLAAGYLFNRFLPSSVQRFRLGVLSANANG